MRTLSVCLSFSFSHKQREREKEIFSEEHMNMKVLCVLNSDLCFFSLPSDKPGAIARSDARPPGMQTVAGSILTSGKTFFR